MDDARSAGFLRGLGFTQRMYHGAVASRVSIKELSCPLNCDPTETLFNELADPRRFRGGVWREEEGLRLLRTGGVVGDR